MSASSPSESGQRVCPVCARRIDGPDVTIAAMGRPLLRVHEQCAPVLIGAAHETISRVLRFTGNYIRTKAPVVFTVLKTAYLKSRGA